MTLLSICMYAEDPATSDLEDSVSTKHILLEPATASERAARLSMMPNNPMAIYPYHGELGRSGGASNKLVGCG